jgi:hypothetical protein
MSFNIGDIPAEILAAVPQLPYYGSVPVTESRIIKPSAINYHVAIEKGGGGESSVYVDDRGMDWSNNGFVYKNTTDNCMLCVQVSVGPVLQQGATTMCQAWLTIGETSPPSTCAGEYWGTDSYSSLLFILDKGLLTAWVPPLWYYALVGGFGGGRIYQVLRYWMPDPGGEPPLQ